MFRAYDKKTGDVVCEFEPLANQAGVPMTYMVSSKQYVVVAVGAREKPAELGRAELAVASAKLAGGNLHVRSRDGQHYQRSRDMQRPPPDRRSISLPVAAFVLIASSALAQKPAPSFPREGSQMVKESPAAAAWDVTLKKGVPTGMRQRSLDEVSITTMAGAVKVTKPDGKWSMEYRQPGAVRFVPKGTVQAEEGVSEPAARAIVFQLKTPHTTAKWPGPPGVPCKLPRAGVTKAFETDRFIIWDEHWMGMPHVRHAHCIESLGVFLKGGRLRTISDDGKAGPVMERKIGDLVFEDKPLPAPGAHAEELVDGSSVQIMWIEFK